jgi:hypothetical protein
MTNAELWNAYNVSEIYEPKMCEEICYRVGMHEDYYYTTGENVDRIMEKAAKKLKKGH